MESKGRAIGPPVVEFNESCSFFNRFLRQATAVGMRPGAAAAHPGATFLTFRRRGVKFPSRRGQPATMPRRSWN